MDISTPHLTIFLSSGDWELVWRLFWLALIPFFPPTCLKSMIPPFVLSSDCLNKGRVYQAPTDWHFPLAAAPTGDSITDSAPLGMDNPRLKPPDSVINDTSTGCDPCSLAVMPHVEPTELGELTRETCTIIHYHSKAAPRQTLTELDSTFISNKTGSAHTVLRKRVE